MSLPALPVFAATLLFSAEEGEHAAGFLGIPMAIWQIANLVLFLAVLVYFVARPMSAAFRKRQDEIEERRRQAEKQRADVDRLSADIRERTAKIEREIEEIREAAVAEGERARAELASRADDEAARAGRDAQEEIARRLAEAKAELRRTAADLTAKKAEEILGRRDHPGRPPPPGRRQRREAPAGSPMSSFTRPYARAFVEAAPTGYDFAAFLEAGETMAQAFEANPKLRAFLLAPNVPREAKSKTIAELAKKTGMNEYGARFLQVMLRNRRLLEAGAVFRALRDLNDELLGVLRVRVTVPAELSESEKQAIQGRHRRADGEDGEDADRPRPEAARRLRGAGGIPGVRRFGGRRDPAVPGACERDVGSVRWRSKRTKSRRS